MLDEGTTKKTGALLWFKHCSLFLCGPKEFLGLDHMHTLTLPRDLSIWKSVNPSGQNSWQQPALICTFAGEVCAFLWFQYVPFMEHL